MPRSSNIARSLRSKNFVKECGEEKYNFDVEEYPISPTKELRLLSRGCPKMEKPTVPHPRGSTNEENIEVLNNVEEKTKMINSMILDIESYPLHEISPTLSDNMLPDDLYYSYHKKMLKQENRMLETDLVHGENEADRLHLLSEKLDMLNWPSILRKVAVINNPTDQEEIVRKKEQTKQYINSMLEKFEAMKRKCNILARNHKTGKIDPSKDWPKVYNNIERKLVINYHSSSDEEEEEMPIDEIRKHRRQKRQQQCKGSIVVQLTMTAHGPNTRYAIVAEPLRRPYVIKVSQSERKKWNKKMEGAPCKFTFYPQLANQNALPKRRALIPLTLLCKLSGNTSLEVPKGPIPIKPLIIKDNNHVGALKLTKRSISDFDSKIHSPPVRRKKKRQE